MNTSQQKSSETLLIIDDMPDNVLVLLDFLNKSGYQVLVSQEGEEGIQRAEYAHPDLILLDVMMPGLNGFEVCKILKSKETTKDIPVIFMTALIDTIDKVKGFEMGAADYITKPIQYEEVLARVSTHLKIHKQKQELKEKNFMLQREIHFREEIQLSLEQANKTLKQRNLELDAFAHTVAQDLKKPLAAMMSVTELLLSSCATTTKTTNGLEKLHWLVQAEEKMDKIINELLLLHGVSSKAKIETHLIDMKEVLQHAMQRVNKLLRDYDGKIDILTTLPSNTLGYAPWVEEVWVNYLTNAIKYGARPPIIKVGATELPTTHMVKFWVHDNGPGLSEEAQSHLFMPFTHLPKERIRGHGLGLSIVKQIIEKLEGQVGIESEIGQGSTFYFSLPIYADCSF